MNTELIRATTEDKLILTGLLYVPATSSKKLVLHIHGMGGNFFANRFLDFISEELTSKGWAFLAPNTRGNDAITDIPVAGPDEKYERIGSYRELFEDCIKDIKTWIDLAESRGYTEIVLQGHSLGAVKAAYYIAKTQDNRVSKLVFMSPPDMVGLLEADKAHDANLKDAKQMMKDGRETDIMPGIIWDFYYLSPRTFLNFSQRGNDIDVFNTYDKKKSSDTLGNITIPVLSITGGKDDANIYTAIESMNVIKQKTNKSPKFDIRVIDGAPHSYFKHEQELASSISAWI